MEPNLLLAATTDLATVLGLIEQNKPALAIVDSAQTIVSQEVDGISGGSTQVREVASALIDTAKTLDIPVFLVGHVTKDGSIAWPSFSNDKKAVVTLGAFDGMHLGHQAVINRVVELAHRHDAFSIVILFDPRPAFVHGWAGAHNGEEIVSGKRIIRPAYKSIRSGKRDYVPMSER